MKAGPMTCTTSNYKSKNSVTLVFLSPERRHGGLLHAVVPDDVALVGDAGVLERPGEVVGLGGREGVIVVLHPVRGGLARSRLRHRPRRRRRR